MDPSEFQPFLEPYIVWGLARQRRSPVLVVDKGRMLWVSGIFVLCESMAFNVWRLPTVSGLKRILTYDVSYTRRVFVAVEQREDLGIQLSSFNLKTLEHQQTLSLPESAQGAKEVSVALPEDGRLAVVLIGPPHNSLLVYRWEGSKLLSTATTCVLNGAFLLANPFDTSALFAISLNITPGACVSQWKISESGARPAFQGTPARHLTHYITDACWVSAASVAACTEGAGDIIILESGRVSSFIPADELRDPSQTSTQGIPGARLRGATCLFCGKKGRVHVGTRDGLVVLVQLSIKTDHFVQKRDDVLPCASCGNKACKCACFTVEACYKMSSDEPITHIDALGDLVIVATTKSGQPWLIQPDGEVVHMAIAESIPDTDGIDNLSVALRDKCQRDVLKLMRLSTVFGSADQDSVTTANWRFTVRGIPQKVIPTPLRQLSVGPGELCLGEGLGYFYGRQAVLPTRMSITKLASAESAGLVALLTKEGLVSVCDIATGAIFAQVQLNSVASGLALHPSGAHLVVALAGSIAMFDITLPTLRRTLDLPVSAQDILFTRNGGLLVAAVGDRVCVYDFYATRLVRTMMGPGGTVTFLTLAEDDVALGVGATEGVSMVDLHSGDVAIRVKLPTPPMCGCLLGLGVNENILTQMETSGKLKHISGPARRMLDLCLCVGTRDGALHLISQLGQASFSPFASPQQGDIQEHATCLCGLHGAEMIARRIQVLAPRPVSPATEVMRLAQIGPTARCAFIAPEQPTYQGPTQRHGAHLIRLAYTRTATLPQLNLQNNENSAALPGYLVAGLSTGRVITIAWRSVASLIITSTAEPSKLMGVVKGLSQKRTKTTTAQRLFAESVTALSVVEGTLLVAASEGGNMIFTQLRLPRDVFEDSTVSSQQASSCGPSSNSLTTAATATTLAQALATVTRRPRSVTNLASGRGMDTHLPPVSLAPAVPRATSLVAPTAQNSLFALSLALVDAMSATRDEANELLKRNYKMFKKEVKSLRDTQITAIDTHRLETDICAKTLTEAQRQAEEKVGGLKDRGSQELNENELLFARRLKKLRHDLKDEIRRANDRRYALEKELSQVIDTCNKEFNDTAARRRDEIKDKQGEVLATEVFITQQRSATQQSAIDTFDTDTTAIVAEAVTLRSNLAASQEGFQCEDDERLIVQAQEALAAQSNVIAELERKRKRNEAKIRFWQHEVEEQRGKQQREQGELAKRDATLSNKDAEIAQLKATNKDLQRTEGLLDYRTQELTAQMRPMDKLIEQIQEQLLDLDAAIGKYEKENEVLDLKRKEIQMRRDGFLSEIDRVREMGLLASTEYKDLARSILFIINGDVESRPCGDETSEEALKFLDRAARNKLLRQLFMQIVALRDEAQPQATFASTLRSSQSQSLSLPGCSAELSSYVLERIQSVCRGYTPNMFINVAAPHLRIDPSEDLLQREHLVKSLTTHERNKAQSEKHNKVLSKDVLNQNRIINSDLNALRNTEEMLRKRLQRIETEVDVARGVRGEGKSYDTKGNFLVIRPITGESASASMSITRPLSSIRDGEGGEDAERKIEYVSLDILKNEMTKIQKRINSLKAPIQMLTPLQSPTTNTRAASTPPQQVQYYVKKTTPLTGLQTVLVPNVDPSLSIRNNQARQQTRLSSRGSSYPDFSRGYRGFEQSPLPPVK